MKNLTLFLLLFSATLFAQDETSTANESKHRISIGFAGAAPGGDFAKTDSDKDESGFAETGRRFYLGYQYNIAPQFYLTAKYDAYGFSVDVDEFANELEKELGANASSVSYTINADGYVVGAFTLGGKYVFGNDEVKGFINPYFGFGSMVIGELDVDLSGPGGTASITQKESDPGSALIYGVDFGVEFILSELINLNLEIGTVASEFEAKGDAVQTDASGTETSTFKYDQPFSAITFGISLGFNF